MTENWYKKEIYFESNSGLKRCEPDDFGSDEQSHYYWRTWITDDY